MNYYRMTKEGVFQPLCREGFKEEQKRDTDNYGVGYVALMTINGAEAIVLLRSADIRLSQGSVINAAAKESSTNHYEQRNKLREAAIADIRAYVEKNGETNMKNLSHYRRIVCEIRHGDLLIKKEPAHACPTEYLCLIADMLNQMP